MKKEMSRILVAACLAVGIAGTAHANPSMLKNFDFNHPVFFHKHDFASRHVVIQVSEGNPARWNLALNNAQNLLDAFGADQVQVVMVAYGPGLKMLFAKSPEASRIQSLDKEGVEFDACHNTMEAMARKLGHMPELVPQAVIVPGGIVRIMQLESHGFDYIKP